MRFILKLCIFCVVLYFLATGTGLIADKAQLKNDVIRMHVVANSNSPKDQQVKLQVKDAIVAYLQPVMQSVPNKADAYRYLQDNLQKLEQTANETLRSLGQDKTVKVTLEQEEFDIRKYDTFILPSGIYDALRVEIGEAEGKNWWCVAFPTFCVPATTNEFSAVAASSGFSDSLIKTISNADGYEIRFYFLDLLGRMEKIFH